MHSLTRHARKGTALVLFTSLFAAVSAARADTLYVANISSSSVEQYTSGGVKSTFNNSALNGPVGLAFDKSGNLFVANNGGNYIEELDSSGAPVRTIPLADGSGPTGLAFDSSGHLYVAENNVNRIDEITLGAVPTVSTFIDFNHDGNLSSPIGLAFDKAGNLYVADSGADHIESITPSKGLSIFADNITTPGNDLSSPFGLAFDKGGNLFVTSFLNNSIEEIAPNGAMDVFANHNTGLDGPTGIAFDSNDNLFVANAGQNLLNTIQEFAAGSSTPTLFATVNDSDHRRLLAFGPNSASTLSVPLPATVWTTVPLLALLGLAQLRRRIA